MNKLKKLEDIIEKIKVVIESDHKDGIKILDRHVAEALGITQSKLGTAKKRNTIPFEEIMNFCVDRSLLIETFFYSDNIGKRYTVKKFKDENYK